MSGAMLGDRRGSTTVNMMEFEEESGDRRHLQRGPSFATASRSTSRKSVVTPSNSFCTHGARVKAQAGGIVLLVAVMIGVALAAFLSEERRKQEEFRHSVRDHGVMYAQDVARQVRSSISSVYAVEAVIKVDDMNLTVGNFDSIARTLIRTYDGITNLQLAPSGTVKYIHPLVTDKLDSRSAIGFALLLDPTQRSGALKTIARRSTTVTGPLRLVQGGVGLLARHPIFSRFAPEFLPSETWTSKDGSVYVRDCNDPAAKPAACRIPGTPEADGTPTFFWGFATVLALVEDLLAPVDLQKLERGTSASGGAGYAYQLLANTPHSSMEDVYGIFAHSSSAPPGGDGLEDPVEVPVLVPELAVSFMLRLAPRDGWPARSSDFWVRIALMLPLTVLVGLGLSLALLGNLRRTYLHARDFEAYKQKKLQQAVLDAVADLNCMRFPMCLISTEVFEGLGRLLSHETAQDECKLRFVDAKETMMRLRDEDGVVFISHQWSGFDEPDPQNVQYVTMVEALQGLKEKGINCRWIWVDYLSIPQQDRILQQQAINSLTAYVAHSSVFVAVTPTCSHVDLGYTVGAHSYSLRGWCRLEQLAYLATSISQTAPAAFACTEAGLGPLWAEGGVCSEEQAMAVMNGTFTCCSRGHPDGRPCDKTKVVGVMLGIYWRLKAWRRDMPDPPERLCNILERMEESVDRFFPTAAEYMTEGGCAPPTELFGDLVPVMQTLFESEASLEPEMRVRVSLPPLDAPSLWSAGSRRSSLSNAMKRLEAVDHGAKDTSQSSEGQGSPASPLQDMSQGSREQRSPAPPPQDTPQSTEEQGSPAPPPKEPAPQEPAAPCAEPPCPVQAGQVSGVRVCL